jgi:hypothetical protein
VTFVAVISVLNPVVIFLQKYAIPNSHLCERQTQTLEIVEKVYFGQMINMLCDKKCKKAIKLFICDYDVYLYFIMFCCCCCVSEEKLLLLKNLRNC